MTTQYRTTISDKRWIAYDIPGNIGWITYLVCMVKGIREKRVVELISERICELDRVLPGKRLLCGFGALTAGGLLGIPIALAGFGKNKKRSLIMLGGSAVCAVFAGLLLVGYKKD